MRMETRPNNLLCFSQFANWYSYVILLASPQFSKMSHAVILSLLYTIPRCSITPEVCLEVLPYKFIVVYIIVHTHHKLILQSMEIYPLSGQLNIL